jgi:hypothetical protein
MGRGRDKGQAGEHRRNRSGCDAASFGTTSRGEHDSYTPWFGNEVALILSGRGEEGRQETSGSMSLAGLIIEMAGPIPNDIQRLAYSAYEVAEGPVRADDVKQSMAETAFHAESP